jgi:hypothetical protein
MRKSEQMAIRLPAETKAALERAAKDEIRSMSSLVERIVTDWLRAHGYLPDKTK